MKRSLAIFFGVCFWAMAVILQYSFRVDDIDSMRKVAQLQNTIATNKEKNQRLTARNEQMHASIRELRSNEDYVVEGLARKWLFMIKPDEVYVMPAK